MILLSRAEYPAGCEDLARQSVRQEQQHGRYVTAHQDGRGVWIVEVWLPDAEWKLLPSCPEWLRRAWQSDERGMP